MGKQFDATVITFFTGTIRNLTKATILGGAVLGAAFSLPAADITARPHVVGLSHIGLYVHDLEKSRAFYKDFLGFDEPYSLTNKDGSTHLTFIKINDRQTI